MNTRVRKVVGLVFISVLSVLALEGLFRLVNRGSAPVNPSFVELSSGYDELDILISDLASTHPSPRYYDEFLYAAEPVSTTLVNFTDYYSARLTPDSVPLGEAEIILWAFGGSTMENTETSDELTIANTWASLFNDSLGSTHVKNFGAGGFFSSNELIKFQKLLREVPEDELPQIVVFYDGYNDSLYGFQYGPGSMQKDLSLKLQAFVEHENFVIWAYVSSRMLSKYSRLWESTGAPFFEQLLFPLPAPDTSEANLEASVHTYIQNVNMAQSICAAYNIQCYFVLQPLIVTKQPLSIKEQSTLDFMESHPRFGREGVEFVRNFYGRASLELEDKPNFIDASHILDGREEADFYDLGHTGALTAPVIGEKTAELILKALESQVNLGGEQQADLEK